jgi:hypothetical protein
MTTSELRNKVSQMTKEEFVTMRDQLENNWNESLREQMQVLSLGCLNKFKTTLVNL